MKIYMLRNEKNEKAWYIPQFDTVYYDYNFNINYNKYYTKEEIINNGIVIDFNEKTDMIISKVDNNTTFSAFEIMIVDNNKILTNSEEELFIVTLDTKNNVSIEEIEKDRVINVNSGWFPEVKEKTLKAIESQFNSDGIAIIPKTIKSK